VLPLLPYYELREQIAGGAASKWTAEDAKRRAQYASKVHRDHARSLSRAGQAGNPPSRHTSGDPQRTADLAAFEAVVFDAVPPLTWFSGGHR